jgi:hypothetical protein
MKCESAQEWLVAYLTGKLPVWRRLTVGLHIRRCTSCAMEANELSEMTSMLSESLADDRELKLEPHRVRKLFAAALGNVVPFSVNRTSRRSPLRTQLAVAAVAVVTIALGSLGGFNYGKSQVQETVLVAGMLDLDLNPSPKERPKITIPIAKAGAEDLNTSLGYGFENGGSLFSSDTFSTRLPEYGMGTISFASQPRKATYPYPYHGVPGPKPSYTAHDRSEPLGK